MRRPAVWMALGMAVATVGYAATDSNALRGASCDLLLTHIQRTADNDERRMLKQAAREELFSRRTNGLVFLMGLACAENMTAQMLTQELVDRLSGLESAPTLLPYLAARDTRTRRLAAYYLGAHDTPQYADKMEPLLDDPEVCGAAVRTLGKWKVRTAVPRLLPFLKHSREIRRVAAANALREIADPAAAPGLIEALADPVFTVREAAQRALTEMGAAVEPDVIRAIKTAQGTSLRCLVRILGESRSRASARALKPLLKTDDAGLRQDVETALRR